MQILPEMTIHDLARPIFQDKEPKRKLARWYADWLKQVQKGKRKRVRALLKGRV